MATDEYGDATTQSTRRPGDTTNQQRYDAAMWIDGRKQCGEAVGRGRPGNHWMDEAVTDEDEDSEDMSTRRRGGTTR